MTLIPEDTKPDYDASPRTEYTVHLSDTQKATITDTEIADRLARNGYRVTATTGWL